MKSSALVQSPVNIWGRLPMVLTYPAMAIGIRSALGPAPPGGPPPGGLPSGGPPPPHHHPECPHPSGSPSCGPVHHRNWHSEPEMHFDKVVGLLG